MSACRALDVMLGAGGSRDAVPAATVVGAHTAVITAVSRREVSGAGTRLPAAALAGTAAVSAAALALGLRRARSAAARIASLALIGGYAGACASAHAAAMRDPSPERLQRAVGTGVLGLMPLEAGLLASEGAPAKAGALTVMWRLARGLARRSSVT
jgi:4-hydroxybenzoate polyprenyltransferase